MMKNVVTIVSWNGSKMAICEVSGGVSTGMRRGLEKMNSKNSERKDAKILALSIDGSSERCRQIARRKLVGLSCKLERESEWNSKRQEEIRANAKGKMFHSYFNFNKLSSDLRILIKSIRFWAKKYLSKITENNGREERSVPHNYLRR